MIFMLLFMKIVSSKVYDMMILKNKIRSKNFNAENHSEISWYRCYYIWNDLSYKFKDIWKKQNYDMMMMMIKLFSSGSK